MKPSIFVIPFFLLSAHDLAGAVRLNARGRPRSRHSTGIHDLSRRASIVGSTSVSDLGDIEYVTDITLGGKSFTVQIDTGSSDLWVVGDVPNAQNTGKSAKVTYAVDEVQGSVFTAPLVFSGYTVSDQAYISVDASSTNPDGSGLIGLGPNYGSQVSAALGDPAGDAVLDNIFRQNTSTPNYITVLLGRLDDPSVPPTGDFTVGELMPGYEQVTSQPKLDVSVVASSDSVNQHWQILLDADGIVGPAGNNVIDQFNIETAVSSTSNKKQLTVVIDTGYSLPQVPTAVAEAFYKDVPGAQLVNSQAASGEVWQIPCDKEINITFKFAGSSFPIHPLDANIDLNQTDSSGNRVCFGAFQPYNPPDSATYDVIFGMAFLRNAYTYINFGDFLQGSTSTTAAPYVQLLSTTNNSASAHADFVKVRGSSPWQPTGATLGERIRAHLPLVIGLSVGAGVVLIGAIVLCCACGSRRRGSTVRVTTFFRPNYQQLHEPAPEAYSMPAVNPPGGYQANYSNPWDARY